MDLMMDSQTSDHTWDFFLSDGDVVTVEGKQETRQLAAIAAYLERGSVPNVGHAGNQWVERLVNEATPNELDSQVRIAMQQATGTSNYMPVYSIKNSTLQLSVQEVNYGN